MKYQEVSKEIVTALGGKENINSLVHCSTRLRFVLNDNTKADMDALKNNKSIMSIVEKGGQFQLVIGSDVDKLYKEIALLINLSEKPSKKNTKKEGIVNKVLSVITGSIAPVIPLLAGAGMGKVLLMILTMVGWLDKSGQTYYMLNFIFDAAFYFMPAFIGFSAAKIFGCNQYLAAVICLAMLSPDWSALIKAKEAVYFIGIPVQLVKYSSQLIPALLTVWMLSYIERFVYKFTPDMVKVFMAPLLTILIAAPIAFIVVGPVANWLAQGVADIVLYTQQTFGFIAIPILAAIYPWLVSIGMHKALSPISIMLVEQTGFDPLTRVIALCSNMSQAAASLAVSIKSKNKELKQVAFSSSMTAFLGGITEPAMYGVTLKLKKPMYACMIGGAAAGLYAGIVQLKAFVYVTPGLLSLPMWISDTDNQLVHAIITLVIASVVTFIATMIIGFDDPVDDTTESSEEVRQSDSTIATFTSPMSGEVVALEQVNDSMFATGVMGKGIAILPSEGKVYAPGNGSVEATFASNHAIGLKLENNVELLIHVGIDTVNLEGKFFESHIKKGQEVKTGDLLITFDMQAIKDAGYDLTTMIIVTNTNDYLEVLPTKSHNVKVNDVLLEVC